MLWSRIYKNLRHLEINVALPTPPKCPTKPAPRWVGSQRSTNQKQVTEAKWKSPLAIKTKTPTNCQMTEKNPSNSKTSQSTSNQSKLQSTPSRSEKTSQQPKLFPKSPTTWLRMPVGLESFTMMSSNHRNTWRLLWAKQRSLERSCQLGLRRRSRVQKSS